MDCRKARNLLSDFQDGAMDDTAAAGLADHLRGCGECAGADASLLAVRKLLRGLPPDPAPPELLARVLAAVEAEGQGARPAHAAAGEDAARPFLSRFRIPLEVAAAVLLFAAVYWYPQIPAPADRPSPSLSAGVPSEAVKAPPSPPIMAKAEPVNASPSGPATATEEAVKAPPSRPVAAKAEAVKAPPSRPAAAKAEAASAPVTAREEVPSSPAPRTWAAGSLPSVPVYFANSNSERVGPTEPEGGGEFRLARSFAAPPSRLFRPWPYGRDIVVDVDPESREGAEDRIAEAALRLGGIFERVDRGGEAAPGGPGTVRVILPEDAATRFLDEMGRLGTIPPAGSPAAAGLRAGPWPGTVAYTVRVRVR
ncbi:zf-HC2 domain-containing protein [bacterium]|nr:zf-HC2 domain-containing protein [bacterium]